MQFGFSMIVRGEDATPETFVALAERAEALGFDSLWCSSHVIIPPQIKSDYVLVPGLRHPEHWKVRYWEPFTVLAHLCARTSRLLLGTSIVVLPMHNPFEVAKQAAEVDQLSAGRFVLGVGVGWFEEEFEILGQRFRDRGRRTDEALRLIDALWTTEPVTFEGEHYRVRDAHFGPKPHRRPRPPVWVAGNSEAGLRRAARLGDAWHPVRPSLDYLETSRRRLEELVAAAGRAPGSVEIAIKVPCVFADAPPGEGDPITKGRPSDIADAMRRYAERGATHCVLDFQPETRANALDTLERFANEVRPRLEG